MLSVLATLDRTRFRPLLCCVDGLGALADDARALSLEPVVLGRRRRFDLGGVARLARLVRREHADVVHGWLDLANAFARVGGRLGHAPVVVAAEGGAITTMRRTRRHLGGIVERGLTPLTDAFVANSDAVASGLRRHGVPARKIEVIRNGVALPAALPAERLAELRASVGAAPGEQLIGMVSRLDPAFKDHPTLLRALARLRERHPAVRLAVVGDGPARAALDGLAGQLGVSDRIAFAGFRPDATELIAAFDVSVLCSFSEGFSNVVLESMAWARPVVATDIPSNREAIDHCVHGLLVPVGDVEATAAAIGRVLDDALLAERLGAAARQRAKGDFSLERQANRTMALYDRLLAEKRR
jgi:glycosyltransferase involved in cell wall biosynthesis